MNNLNILISAGTFIVIGLNFLYQLKEYKKQNRIATLSALLLSAQEVGRRYNGNQTDENKKINDRLNENIMKYCEELMNEVKKK